MAGNLLKVVRYITLTVFFMLTFLYCLHYINPVLICFKQQPLFLFDKYFLYRYLAYPGGLTEYGSLFISQFFCSKLAGSLLLTLLIFLAVYLSNRILRILFHGMTAFFLSFIPGLIMIYLHSHYEYDLRGDLIFIVALIAALIWHKLFSRPVIIRLIFLVVADIVLFYCCGGTSLLLFSAMVVLSGIYHSHQRLSWLTVTFQVLLCFFIFLIVPLRSPHISFKMAYLGILCPGMYYKPLKYLYTLYIVIPFLLLIRVVLKYAWEGSGLSVRFETRNPERASRIIIPLLSLAITGLLIIDFRVSYSQTDKDSILIHYKASAGDWESVLKTSEALSTTDRTVLFQVNRALYHLGKLPDQAFGYAQYWGENGLILTSHYSHDVLMFCSDLYFDMGHIKESLHWAYEAQTKSDQAPDVLKRIVINNIILGDYVIAEKFLKFLSQSVLHKKWAKYYAAFLYNENLIRQDQLLNEKRMLMPRKDFLVNTQNPQYDLVSLLQQNPMNRMAYEYFMMVSLFKHDLSTVAVNLKYLDRLRFDKIPVHIEEALVLILAMNPEYQPDLGNYEISQQTKERFMGYSKILIANKRDRVAAQSDLFRDYGNTYWYYIYYVSPITTKRKIYEKTN